jgi:Flp pilus assembly protein TadD
VTGQHGGPSGAHTRLDALRDDIFQCEVRVSQIGVGDESRKQSEAADKTPHNNGYDRLQLLCLLDHVADELEHLEQQGVDLRAERTRFESALSQLSHRQRVLVKQVGSEMAHQRPQDARWWWYLDEKVAADRRRVIKRAVAAVIFGLSLLMALYFLYDRVLAPPPHVRQAATDVFKGEKAAVEGDLTQAVAQFEAAATQVPDDATAQLWLGVLYQDMGRTDEATCAFERAQETLGSGPEFLLQRGLLYLMLNDFDAAGNDALAAIELDPERPEGYFLQGSVAEAIGDLELALASFRRASELAESTGDPELYVIARLRMGAVMQRVGTIPPQ